MAEDDKPGKASLETTELKVGGVTLKGSYIVWGLAIAGSIAGSIMLVGSEWEKYQRVKNFVSEFKSPDLEPLVQLSEKVKQLDETTVNLSQAIAENQAIGSKLTQDLRSIQTLVEANDVSKLQGAIATLKTTVDGVQVFTRDVQDIRVKLTGIEKDFSTLKKDVDSTWNAIDTLGANGLKR